MTEFSILTYFLAMACFSLASSLNVAMSVLVSPEVVAVMVRRKVTSPAPSSSAIFTVCVFSFSIVDSSNTPLRRSRSSVNAKNNYLLEEQQRLFFYVCPRSILLTRVFKGMVIIVLRRTRHIITNTIHSPAHNIIFATHIVVPDWDLQ